MSALAQRQDDQPYFLLMISSATGIAPMASIIRNGSRGSEHGGWVKNNLLGAAFVQLNSRRCFCSNKAQGMTCGCLTVNLEGSSKQDWTPDDYYQSVLLPPSVFEKWNRMNPQSTISYHACVSLEPPLEERPDSVLG